MRKRDREKEGELRWARKGVGRRGREMRKREV
jgi:hypothetical protein